MKHAWPLSEATQAEWKDRKLPRRNQSAPAASYDAEARRPGSEVEPPFPGRGRLLDKEDVQSQLERLQTFQDFQTVQIKDEDLTWEEKAKLLRPFSPRPSLVQNLEKAAQELAVVDAVKEDVAMRQAAEEEEFFGRVVDIAVGFRDGTSESQQTSSGQVAGLC